MTPPLDDSERKRYLDVHARCIQAFTPFAPVELPDFFAGRLQVIKRVVTELSIPGRHVAIYGERGVGKTSLATLLSFFTPFPPNRTHRVSADADSTFESLLGRLLAAAGAEFAEVERHDVAHRGVGIGAAGLRADRKRRSATTTWPVTARVVDKARLVQTFQDAESLLIIDEYDRISDQKTHRRVAELVKALSDQRSTSQARAPQHGSGATDAGRQEPSAAR